MTSYKKVVSSWGPLSSFRCLSPHTLVSKVHVNVLYELFAVLPKKKTANIREKSKIKTQICVAELFFFFLLLLINSRPLRFIWWLGLNHLTVYTVVQTGSTSISYSSKMLPTQQRISINLIFWYIKIDQSQGPLSLQHFTFDKSIKKYILQTVLLYFHLSRTLNVGLLLVMEYFFIAV